MGPCLIREDHIVTVIKNDTIIYSMDAKAKPVAEVEVGETVIYETIDAFGNQIKSEKDLFESADWSTVNPASGPVAVKNAEPGDMLIVDIYDIEVGSSGVMVTVPEMGALGHIIKESESKIIKIEKGFARFNEDILLPLDPMIGVIGTAPAGEPVPNGTPDNHGGNMDCKVVKKGNRVYLPVNVPGALLAMGDLHAVMADGEVVICGIEVAGKVTVKIDLIKEKQVETPVVESKDYWYIIGSKPDLDQAVRYTLDQTFNFLEARLPLSTNDICMLMSIIGDLQICQIVDPQITCRMAIPKAALARYNVTF